jgi:hypothetical protein
MKRKYFTLIILLSLFILSACSKYTDFTPKGKNLLNNVVDLDRLLNYQYTGTGFNFMKQYVLINDMYPALTNMPNLINGNVKDMNYTLTTYSNSIDRAALTATDGPYEGLYSIINNVSNIVLIKADAAIGDRVLAQRLKAEAYVIRAYMHYLLVNIYAKAYDSATAAKDGGIPYVKDINLEEVNVKRTVQEVYSNLLSDIDAAFALNALPDYPINSMRVGKGFAYAVKARILLSMRNYPAAQAAAEASLSFNSTLEDHRPFLKPPAGLGLPVSRNGVAAPDNLFFAYLGKIYPYTYIPSLEILKNYYEQGNILKDSTNVYDYVLGSALSGVAGVAMFATPNYQQNAGGMTASDTYLIKAECLIRSGKISEGMDIINEIRKRRIYPYTPLTAFSDIQAMGFLQRTTRIEFLFTWRNFVDIKRWNAEGKYAQIIVRTINGVRYELTPNSPLWIFPFPKSGTDFNSTLTQNY